MCDVFGLTMPRETGSHIGIDCFLCKAGWDIEDKTQVATEVGAAHGGAHYVLRD